MRTFLTLQNLDQIPTLHSLNKQHPGDTSHRPEKEFKYVFLKLHVECGWFFGKEQNEHLMTRKFYSASAKS